ncbi:MAG: polysaccharide biosynthesis transport protein [Fimbriimonadaceae bacterium]|jgi:capsular exopolysaccharide synthesis family protein|nr:polysaccharide biosynthesis transport protein [Fimbriimonadaceae bacterium]
MAGSLLAKRVGIGAALGIVAGFVVSLIAPKIYESRSEIWIQGDTSTRQAQPFDAPLATQLQLLRSEGVYREAYKAALRKRTSEMRVSQPVQPDLNLYRMYSVEASPGSAVALVRVRAYDPKFAATLANEISFMYRIIRAKATTTAVAARQQGLIHRADQAKQDLDLAESRMQEYKAQTGSPDLNQTTQQTLSYEASLTARLNDAKSELAQAQRELQTLGGLISKRPRQIEQMIERGPNPEALALQNSLSDLQRQRIDLLRTYTETSSRVKAIDEAIAETQRKFASANAMPWEKRNSREVPDPQREQYQLDFSGKLSKSAALRAEIGNLTTTLAKVQGEVARLPRAQAVMQRLQRGYDLALSKYNTLQQQLLEKESEVLPAVASAVSLRLAQPDPKPVSPNVPLLLLLGGGLGALCGGIYTLATRTDFKPVRTGDDLERLTGLSASAVLALPRKKEEQLLRALPDPGTKPAEAFKFMALTMPPGEGAKKILFTGVGSDAGCSTAAGQFALALAHEGRPTLLVDCDFRDSSLTRAFHSEEKPGLSDILRKTLLPSADNDVSMSTQHENLLFLPSGSSGDGSIADFSHSQLKAAFEMLTERADVLVLDAPPCDVVTDAVRLCPLVDEIYLVVPAEETDASKITMAHRLLRKCGAKEVHVLLTGSDANSAPFARA